MPGLIFRLTQYLLKWEGALILALGLACLSANATTVCSKKKICQPITAKQTDKVKLKDQQNQLNSVSPAKPPPIGNFILPTSQQPGPLLAFGENILEKGQFQLYLFADNFVGVNKHYQDLIPSFTYGITNRWSLFANQPIALSYKENGEESSGLEDTFLQFEYTYFNKDTYSYGEQGTVVGNITLPTGSSEVSPRTGYGAPAFFFGTTFNRAYTHWFGFVSPGTLQTSSKDNTKFGNQYYYQFGLGRNLFDIGTTWIIAAMVEMDGNYGEHDRIDGVTDPDSGGNIIYATPSLWISSTHIIIQLGGGVPITQHYFGDQTRQNYVLAANLGWTFS